MSSFNHGVPKKLAWEFRIPTQGIENPEVRVELS
jgi:hypothetical protein